MEAIDVWQIIGVVLVAPVLMVLGPLACWELFKVIL